MSITAWNLQPLPLESRFRRLGRRLSFWWRRETTAADVSNAFHAAAKAHEKYAKDADSTHRLMREWSSQLRSPAFAPELGNPALQAFMLDMCSAVRPDLTQTRQLNELLTSVTHTFESLIIDETNCKKFVHEIMTARKNVDKCRSNSQDPGLLEKCCEHWEYRLAESIRALRTKSATQLRADIAALLEHLKAVAPAVHHDLTTMDNAYEELKRSTALEASLSQSEEHISSPRRQEASRSPVNPYEAARDDALASPPLFMNYDPQMEQPLETEEHTSVYSGLSMRSHASDVNRWVSVHTSYD